MKEINFEFCINNGMQKVYENVTRDTSYFLSKDGYTILVYTQSTTGYNKIEVYNPFNNKQIEMSIHRTSFTTDDLRTLCDLVDIEYPFT